MVPGRDDKHPMAEVEDHGHLFEEALFRGGDGEVHQYLTSGSCAAAEVDQGGCPGACRKDGEVGVDLGGVGELDSSDMGGGCGSEEQRGDGPAEEGYAICSFCEFS